MPHLMQRSLFQVGLSDLQSPVLYSAALPGVRITAPTSMSRHVISESFFLALMSLNLLPIPGYDCLVVGFLAGVKVGRRLAPETMLQRLIERLHDYHVAGLQNGPDHGRVHNIDADGLHGNGRSIHGKYWPLPL